MPKTSRAELLSFVAASTCVTTMAAFSAVFISAVLAKRRASRAPATRRVRAGVTDDIAYSLSEREFKRCYRMDRATFDHVVSRVRPHLEAGHNGRGDELEPDLALSLGLHASSCTTQLNSAPGKLELLRAASRVMDAMRASTSNAGCSADELLPDFM
jgi:hypothetical protein